MSTNDLEKFHVPSRKIPTSGSKRLTTTSPSVTPLSTRSIAQSEPWKPAPYQKKGVKWLLQRNNAALFFDPGLRKTSTALAACKVLKDQGLLGKVLIVAPLRVCHHVWPPELKKWKDFHGLSHVVLHGPDKDELLEQDVDLYIINPEGLEWLLNVTKWKDARGKTQVQVDLKRWRQLGFTRLIIDELTKFKNHQSNRFKAMRQVLSTFVSRWGLTGSPAANGLLGLFGQIYMLDQGLALGKYVTHFRNQFFTPHPNGFTWVVQKDGEKRIYERLGPLALRLDAGDYVHIPEVVENTIIVELPPKARLAYDAMEKDLLTYLEGAKVSAAAAGAKYGKCRQLASGAVFVDQEVLALVKLPRSERRWAELHEAKLDALEDLLEELQGAPLLLAYEFQHDLERLTKRFKQFEALTGPAKRDSELIVAFNRGDLPGLLVHPMTGGHGLNLQGSSCHVGFFSPTPDYELKDQFIRRVRRSGNAHKHVFVHQFVAKDTVDDRLTLPLIAAKARGQDDLFTALKKYKKG